MMLILLSIMCHSVLGLLAHDPPTPEADAFNTAARCAQLGVTESECVRPEQVAGAEQDAEPVLVKKALDTSLVQKRTYAGSLWHFVVCAHHCEWQWTSDFYNLAHMVNDPTIFYWAMSKYANSVEFDVRYTHNEDLLKPLYGVTGWYGGAEPLITHHGDPCDCSCHAFFWIASITGESVCEKHMGLVLGDQCQENANLDTMLHLFAQYQVAAVYFDNKAGKSQATGYATYKGFVQAGYGPDVLYFGRVSDWDYWFTAHRLGFTINNELRGWGFHGICMVGIAENPSGHFVRGLMTALHYYSEWAVEKTWTVWESNYDEQYLDGYSAMSWSREIKYMIGSYMSWGNWPHRNSPYRTPGWKVAASQGQSNCARFEAHKFLTYAQNAVSYRQVNYGKDRWGSDLGLDYVLTWTIDGELEMQDYINLGVDGLITNKPKKLYEVVRKYGIHMPSR
jgi:hypothetical protein